MDDDRERWLRQVWRWWTVMRLDTAEMSKISLVPESSIERDLNALLDARWKQSQGKIGSIVETS